MASKRETGRISCMPVYSFFVVMLILCGGDAKKNEQQCEKDSREIGKDENKYVKYFKDCISDYYDFKPSGDEKMWTKVPTLEKVLADPHFTKAALVAEEFFHNGGQKRKWDEVNALWPKDKACLKMLEVTAARYIYYTYKLVELSKPKAFGLCKTEQGEGNDGQKYVLPEFSCYPENAGSKRCTSDADVGLVGPGSGKLVSDYNKFIKEKFGMTSEELFDNNMYGYSIEMAMPAAFVAPPGKKDEYKKFKKKLESIDDDVHYQMQDLVFAYYKVYIHRYMESDEFNLIATSVFWLAGKYKEQLEFWDETLKKTVKKINEKKENAENKDYPNYMYSWLVEYKAGHNEDFDTKMYFLLLSHVYASEAYLTRGVLRVVVGAQQMRRKSVEKRLSPLDHWCSMVENYGDTMKEYKRECEKSTATTGSCLMKLSKYLWRSFYSAEQLYKSLENNNIGDIKDAGFNEEMRKTLKKIMENFGKESDVRATDILKHWIDDFKDSAVKDIKKEYVYKPNDPKKENKKLKKIGAGKQNWMAKFFELIGCIYKKDGKFPTKCMEQISNIIRAFNERMAYLTNKGKVAKKNCIDKAC